MNSIVERKKKKKKQNICVSVRSRGMNLLVNNTIQYNRRFIKALTLAKTRRV
jgi:hypothetical protein